MKKQTNKIPIRNPTNLFQPPAQWASVIIVDYEIVNSVVEIFRNALKNKKMIENNNYIKNE